MPYNVRSITHSVFILADIDNKTSRRKKMTWNDWEMCNCTKSLNDSTESAGQENWRDEQSDSFVGSFVRSFIRFNSKQYVFNLVRDTCLLLFDLLLLWTDYSRWSMNLWQISLVQHTHTPFFSFLSSWDTVCAMCRRKQWSTRTTIRTVVHINIKSPNEIAPNT